MSWSKTFLLVSVLGLTWAKRDASTDGPSLAVSNAHVEMARTNAVARPAPSSRWSAAAFTAEFPVAGMNGR